MYEPMKIGPSPCPNCGEEYGHTDDCKYHKMHGQEVSWLYIKLHIELNAPGSIKNEAELADWIINNWKKTSVEDRDDYERAN